MGKGSKIVLPQDQSTRKALEDKLKEYKGRIEEKYSHLDPESMSAVTSSGYKIAVLEELFKKGEVDCLKFSLELKEREGFFNSIKYDKAVFVINDYCATGGSNVFGGTGFPLGEKRKKVWKQNQK